MKKTKYNGRAMSMSGGLAVGALVSIGVTLILSAGVASMVVHGRLPEVSIGYAVLCILLASATLGAAVAANEIKTHCYLVCILSGTVYLVVLMAATAMLFGGKIEAVGVTALLIYGGSAAAALCRGGRTRERGRTKYRCDPLLSCTKKSPR